MICLRQQEILKGRMKKKIKQILLYGKQLRRNTLCDGKAHGALVFRDGILNARQWQRSIWVKNLIYMAVVWIFYFLIMKVKSHKVPSAITKRLFVTGFIII